MTQIHEAALAAQADAEAKLAAAEAAARARAVRPRPRRAPPCDDAAGHRLRPESAGRANPRRADGDGAAVPGMGRRPSYREMAARCGHRAAASTMNTALRRDELPDRLWLLDAIVEGVRRHPGGPRRLFHRLAAAYGGTPPPAPGTQHPAPGRPRAAPRCGRCHAADRAGHGGDDETGIVEAIRRPAAGQAGRLPPQAPS